MKHGTNSNPAPLPGSFYTTTPLRLARTLIGKSIVRFVDGQRLTVRIVETEAYGGGDDPASHAYRGMTDRNRVMFSGGGFAYVYFTYGMHFCFNVTAGKNGKPGAVLIRAAQPVEGIDIMMRNRKKEKLRDLLSGPAKLCQALAIDRSLNGVRLDAPALYLADTGYIPARTAATPRIGITSAIEKKWRYLESGNEFVSSFSPPPRRRLRRR
jgi:DNA-3-methyladenine glycosylase